MSDWFWDKLDRWGNRIALVNEAGDELSYCELARLADQFAQHLGPDRQLVLIKAGNNVAAVVALMACLRARHPAILSSEIGATRIIETFQPNIVVDEAGHISRYRNAPHALHGDLALLLSTSGSTGAAKLVRLSHEALHANAASIVEYLGISDRDVPITTLPVTYSYGLSVLTSHLLAGAKMVLTERSVVEADFWNLFCAQQATSIAGVPYTYELLEASGFRERDVPTLRTLTQAGGRLDTSLRAKYHAWGQERDVRFFVMYGQTEATARMAYLSPELQAEFGDSIGRAIPGGALHVEDDTGNRLPAGKVGELVYEGPNVMMGYANTPAELADGRELSALHTGDLGEERAPGVFRIVGRLSRFSKIAGLRVSLDEIEKLLAANDIRAVVNGDDEAIAVCLEHESLCASAASLLDQNMTIPPRALIFLAPEELPRLSSGKPDNAAILRMAKELREAHDAESQNLDLGGLAAIYARALNRAEIERDQSFASLGGDSLGYIEVSLGIEKLLGYLPEHWETLTVAQIEQMASARPHAGTRKLVTVETEMLIRPAAMTTIVAGHVMGTMDGLQATAEIWDGGALALLMMAGYNVCRFQKGVLLSDRRFEVVTNFARRILLPFYLLILYKCVQWLKGGPYVAWSTFLLLDDYIRYPDAASFLVYWFIGALFQCILVITLAFNVRGIRDFARRSGYNFGLSLLAFAYLAKISVFIILLPQGALMFPNIQLDRWAYAFALGWAVAEARSDWQRVLCIALGIVASGIDWGLTDSHTIGLTLALLLILYLPRVGLPSIVNAPLALWARATFFIYLTHGFAMAATRTPAVRALCQNSDAAIVAMTVLLSTLGGIIFYLLWRRGERLVDWLGGFLRQRLPLLQQQRAAA